MRRGTNVVARHLRMGVRPFLSRLRALVLEHGHVLEARIALQIRDAQGIGLQHALDLFIRKLRERREWSGVSTMISCAPIGGHAVVDSFGAAPGFAFDAVERAEMRDTRAPARARAEGNSRRGLRARSGFQGKADTGPAESFPAPDGPTTTQLRVMGSLRSSIFPKEEFIGAILYRSHSRDKIRFRIDAARMARVRRRAILTM